jgi:hypothetical protein
LSTNRGRNEFGYKNIIEKRAILNALCMIMSWVNFDVHIFDGIIMIVLPSLLVASTKTKTGMCSIAKAEKGLLL